MNFKKIVLFLPKLLSVVNGFWLTNLSYNNAIPKGFAASELDAGIKLSRDYLPNNQSLYKNIKPITIKFSDNNNSVKPPDIPKNQSTHEHLKNNKRLAKNRTKRRSLDPHSSIDHIINPATISIAIDKIIFEFFAQINTLAQIHSLQNFETPEQQIESREKELKKLENTIKKRLKLTTLPIQSKQILRDKYLENVNSIEAMDVFEILEVLIKNNDTPEMAGKEVLKLADKLKNEKCPPGIGLMAMNVMQREVNFHIEKGRLGWEDFIQKNFPAFIKNCYGDIDSIIKTPSNNKNRIVENKPSRSNNSFFTNKIKKTLELTTPSDENTQTTNKVDNVNASSFSIANSGTHLPFKLFKNVKKEEITLDPPSLQDQKNNTANEENDDKQSSNHWWFYPLIGVVSAVSGTITGFCYGLFCTKKEEPPSVAYRA